MAYLGRSDGSTVVDCLDPFDSLCRCLTFPFLEKDSQFGHILILLTLDSLTRIMQIGRSSRTLG